jgi:hypothetical protein
MILVLQAALTQTFTIRNSEKALKNHAQTQ